MSYNGIGLSTPRGSGTSGFIQRNTSHISASRKNQLEQQQLSNLSLHNENNKKPKKSDQSILEHEKKRNIEVKCLQLRDSLEEKQETDSSITDEIIEEKVNKLRQELKSNLDSDNSNLTKRKFKGYETHEIIEAKEKENLKIRDAMNLRRDDEKETKDDDHDYDRDRNHNYNNKHNHKYNYGRLKAPKREIQPPLDSKSNAKKYAIDSRFYKPYIRSKDVRNYNERKDRHTSESPERRPKDRFNSSVVYLDY